MYLERPFAPLFPWLYLFHRWLSSSYSVSSRGPKTPCNYANILIANLALVDLLNALINMPIYLLYGVLEMSCRLVQSEDFGDSFDFSLWTFPVAQYHLHVGSLGERISGANIRPQIFRLEDARKGHHDKCC